MKPQEMFTKVNQKFSGEFAPKHQPSTTTAFASTSTTTPGTKSSSDKIHFMYIHRTDPPWQWNYRQTFGK
jgi:hypothetical protein